MAHNIAGTFCYLLYLMRFFVLKVGFLSSLSVIFSGKEIQKQTTFLKKALSRIWAHGQQKRWLMGWQGDLLLQHLHNSSLFSGFYFDVYTAVIIFVYVKLIQDSVLFSFHRRPEILPTFELYTSIFPVQCLLSGFLTLWFSHHSVSADQEAGSLRKLHVSCCPKEYFLIGMFGGSFWIFLQTAVLVFSENKGKEMPSICYVTFLYQQMVLFFCGKKNRV